MKKTTGNAAVDKMLEINISGNIIPQQWYSSIVRDNGKPYFTAIVILSDIVYWYRPIEIRDEQTGQIKEYRKKFARDKLQRSYQQIANMFGISKREATTAISFLEKLGVIKKEFRSLNINGITCNNVLFIDLFPERVKELTYPPLKNVTPLTSKSDTPPFEKEEGYTPKSDTDTYTSSKISQKTSYSSKEIYKESGENEKANIKNEFETIWKEYPNKKGKDKAFTYYKKARESGTSYDEVYAGLQNYLKEIRIQRKEKQFIKNGSTWFYNHSWNDEYNFDPPMMSNQKQLVNINGKDYIYKNGEYFIPRGSGIAVNPFAEDDLPF